MFRRLSWGCAAAALFLVMSAALADDAAKESGPFVPPGAYATQEIDQRQVALFEALRDGTSPRDWMLAGVMGRILFFDNGFLTVGETAASRARHRAEADALVDKAAAAAPDDRFVQWLARDNAGDAKAGRVRRVQALEPDNGLAWLPVLDAAMRAGNDAPAIDAAVARIARATYDDDHVAQHLALLFEAWRRHPALSWTPPELAASGVAAIDHAYVWASAHTRMHGANLGLLERACDAAQADAGARRLDDCAAIGRRLLRGAPTYALRSAGVRVLGRAGRRTADDAALERDLVWLSLRSQQLLSSELAPAAAYRERAAAWLETRDDAAMSRALLEKHGIATRPPDDWEPPRAPE